MALNALKLISRATETTWNKHRHFQLTALVQRFAFSTQDQAHAFWDDEGSSAVDQNKPSDRKPIEQSSLKQKPAKVESEEVIRHTKFGYVRLDSENRPPETPPEEQEQEKLNFIDNQFFGSSVNKAAVHEEYKIESKTTSKDVPQDTNSIDQQYFYPSQIERDPIKFQGPPPSASELDFSDNEVDNQYFGMAKNDTADEIQMKPSGSKVSAFDYLYSKVEDWKVKKNIETNEKSDEHWKKYISMVPSLIKLPDDAIVAILKKNILHNKDGIVALNKPYGLVTTDVDKNADIVLTKYLPRLSEKLGFKKLHTVHRLDRDTTGVLLLASDESIASKLNSMFANHEIKKRYLAITKGIPNPREGTISIPLYEKNVFGRQRMALRPVLPHSENSEGSSRYNAKVKTHRAITHFRIIRTAKSAAFIELEPETGVRHQLRVHLSEAINCPILGDHKYSHGDKYAPQKLPQDILDSLKIRQAKVRNIPMHLHATFVSIPGLGLKGQPLEIHSSLPQFFRYTMKQLGLYSSKS